MTRQKGFLLQAEWEPAGGVVAPELANTWCALEIRIDGRPVTLVEDARGGGLRRALHTSAYPLAEWIAQRWWLLNEHVRPSATPSSSWLWRHSSRAGWLRCHNIRAAGDGMPWPDLTLVPEGAVTRAVWSAGPGPAGQPLTFLTTGDAYVRTADVRAALASFVEQVLDRLREADVRETPLQQEWQALAALDDEEREFARAAARLGIDPFDVDEDTAAQLEQISDRLDADLLAEFLDSADPGRLPVATEWLERARGNLRPAGTRPSPDEPAEAGDWERPWRRGYAAAKAYRARLGLEPTEAIDLRDRVGLSKVGGDSAGLHGLVGVVADGVGLVLPDDSMGTAATRFAQGRALGLAMLTTRQSALLDPTGTELAKATRAFAAELLAPAEGIAEYLSHLPAVTDGAFDAIANRYDASAVLIQRQYDNQLV